MTAKFTTPRRAFVRAAFFGGLVTATSVADAVPASAESVGTSLQLRCEAAAAWDSENPILAAGEPGYETDTGVFKIGDGVTSWVELDHFAPAATQDAMYVGRASLASASPADLLASSTTGAAVLCDPAPGPLNIDTPGGGKNVTHPSVYFNPKGWNGKRYWMVVTPYDGLSVGGENPCIYASDDGDTWKVPPGVANPIEAAPGKSAYNSDPHLVMGPDGRLYCFWRKFDPYANGAEEKIFYRASSDGTDWSDRQLALSNAAGTRRLVAPAIVYEAGVWRMWAVDIVPSPNAVVEMTATSPAGPWSAPITCSGIVSNPGREPWHLDVHRIGSEYVMLYMDVTLDGSDGGTLYRAVSRNAIDFTQDADPFMVPTNGSWSASFYRSCLLPAEVMGRMGYEVWYSSATPTYRVGRTVAMLSDSRPFQDDASNLAAAIGPYAGYVLGDVVTRSDKATSPGNCSSGQPWIVDTGAFGVQSRALYLPAPVNSRATIDVGLVDVEVGCTLRTLMPTEGQQWLLARFTDPSNYLRAGLKNGNWTIETVSGGTATALATLSAVKYLPPRNGQRLRLICKGSVTTLYVDGRPVCAATTGERPNATTIGLQANQTSVRFTNIYARPA